MFHPEFLHEFKHPAKPSFKLLNMFKSAGCNHTML